VRGRDGDHAPRWRRCPSGPDQRVIRRRLAIGHRVGLGMAKNSGKYA
jgi:hypothetical protein